MLIVLSLCESKPSLRPAQCHVGTQWCIYSVQIHGRVLTCFMVLYVDLHQPCKGAAGGAGKTSRSRTTMSLLATVSLVNLQQFVPDAHVVLTLSLMLQL